MFDQLGPVICPPGWFASLLGENFSDGIAVLFTGIAEAGGGVGVDADRQADHRWHDSDGAVL